MSTRTRLLLLCLAAFGAATAVTYGVFQAVPHLEDEHANLFQAKVFATGLLYAPSPSQPGAFFVPFVIDWEGRRFSKYPPGYSLVLALGVLLRMPWLLNPLLGVVGLVATFALGRELFPDDENVAMLAAILGATSPMFLGLSSALLAHALTLVLLTTFAWALLRSTRCSSHSTSYSIVAGIALGWAALARPVTALAFALPFGGWLAWQVAQRRVRLGPAAAVVLLAGGLSLLVPLHQWVLTGDSWVNLYSTWWGYDRLGFGLGYGPQPEGHSLSSALHNVNLDLDSLFTDLYGWPGLSWVLFVPGLLMSPRDRRDVGLLVPVAALAVGYGMYWVRGSGIYGPRYWYEAMPFLWLLSARGLAKLWGWAQRWGAARAAVRIGLAVLIALNVVMTVPMRFAFWRGLYFVTSEPWRTVQQADLHNALVIVRGGLWTEYGAVLWANLPTLDGDIVFARDQGQPVNEAVIAQYAGRRVYWMEGTRLVALPSDEK